MDIYRTPIGRLAFWISLVLVAVVCVAIASSADAQSGPAITVTPQSGVRPLTVTVTGTPCVDAGETPPPVRLVWQVEGNPSTEQVRIFLSEAGASWTTTLVLGVPNLGVNVVSATCVGPTDQALVTYPDQKVEVLPVPPSLTASPTSITVGETVTATANRCPDPELPRLGGGYFVRFTIEYLPPPSGTHPIYSQSTVVWTSESGDASVVRRALAELPEEFRTPILLCDLDEMPYREIAATLEIPLGTVRSRIARGRALLRRRLSTYAQELGYSLEEPGAAA